MTQPVTTLSPKSFSRGLAFLREQDPDIRQILDDLGPPPMWARKPGFPTLVQIILEQQVSLASARAAFDRLLKASTRLSPERFLDFDDVELKRIGFSRQKTSYCRELAGAIVEGELNLDDLVSLDDMEVRSRLTERRGIGLWTADIYLLMALLRPDIWPSGDLALVKAVEAVKGVPPRLGSDELESISKSWRPWRAVAARVFWHYYLNCL